MQNDNKSENNLETKGLQDHGTGSAAIRLLNKFFKERSSAMEEAGTAQYRQIYRFFRNQQQHLFFP